MTHATRMIALVAGRERQKMAYERKPDFELFEIPKPAKKSHWYTRKMTDEERKKQQRQIGQKMGKANVGNKRLPPIKAKVLSHWGYRSRMEKRKKEAEALISELSAKYPDRAK
jgi:hypothetical protein